MNLVSSRFGDDVHDASTRASEFGAEGVGLYLELLHAVDYRHVGRRVEHGRVGGYAVDKRLITYNLAAAGREVALVVGIGAGGNAAEGSDRLGTGGQPDQRERVTADQRKVGNLAITHHLSQRRGVGLQQRSFRRHLDRFAGLPDLQNGIDRDLLLDVDHDIGADELLEARCFAFQAVAPRRNLWKRVGAGAARGMCLAGVGVLVHQRDGGFGYGCAAGVGNRSADAACLSRQAQ